MAKIVKNGSQFTFIDLGPLFIDGPNGKCIPVPKSFSRFEFAEKFCDKYPDSTDAEAIMAIDAFDIAYDLGIKDGAQK